jgi:aminotransferase/cystathionine beta-lyase
MGVYDFTTIINRSGTGASKWDAMKAKNPLVPPDIVPLSVADMEFRMAPEITQGLKAYLEDLVLGYTVGGASYYDAVCGWMKTRHGWDIKDQWIVPTQGVVNAFFSAIKALTEPGDGVIILSPVYYPFYRAVERNGRRLVTSELIIEPHPGGKGPGRYVVNYPDLEAKARDPANKVLLFCSPHNPVGRVWEREELERIGRICLENKVTVISDEIHFDLILKGHTHHVFAALNEEFAANTITCTAPSKTFNLAGLHSSNIIISNPTLRGAFRKTLEQNAGSIRLNVFGYKACEIAYTRCGAWLDELLQVLERNKTAVERFMAERIPAIKVFDLEGTYLQWWDCRGLGMDSAALEQCMTREALLFLDDGYLFGEGGNGYERINLACPRAVLEAALERLAEALSIKDPGINGSY